MTERALRVLVVDDTVVYRRVLQKAIAEIPGAEVVGIAANGRIALEKLAQLNVEFVLLDVEMPEMNGIETLKEIRQRWPSVGVVLLSGADRRSADMTMKALELGALDFLPKADTGDVQRNQRQLVAQLSGIIRGFEVARSLGRAEFGGLKTQLSKPPTSTSTQETKSLSVESDDSREKEERVVRRSTVVETGQWRPAAMGDLGCDNRSRNRQVERALSMVMRPRVEALLIGSSTGGPQVLAKLIPELPRDLGIPVLVVQHMPAVFTASLAASLNRCSKVHVVEATENQLIVANNVYIAPGGRHMTVKGEPGSDEKRIVLNDDAPVNSVRPAVDVLFLSAAQLYRGATLSVILTGMGEDGLEGVRALRNYGGRTLTQSAASCVVYGMPRAVERAGLSDESVSVENLASRITYWVRSVFNNVVSSNER